MAQNLLVNGVEIYKFKAEKFHYVLLMFQKNF